MRQPLTHQTALRLAALVASLLLAGSAKAASNACQVIFEGKASQSEIWNLRKAGRSTEADVKEKTLTDTLTNAKIIDEKWSGGGVTGAKLIFLEDGTKAILKDAMLPIDGPKHEVAAYRIDRMLGLNQVPTTVLRRTGNKLASVQVFVNSRNLSKLREYPQAFSVFDYLIGNIDRNGGNYLITRDNHVALIDNALTFMPSSGLFAKRLDDAFATLRSNANALEMAKAKQAVNSIFPDRAVIEALSKIKLEDWQSNLGDALSKMEIEFLFKRQQEILKTAQEAESLLGDDAYPSGASSPLLRRWNP